MKGLDAYRNELVNPSHQGSKGQLIDSILDFGLSQSVQRSVNKLLHVISSLALVEIRDAEARALANAREHRLPTTADKSDAVTEMWSHLRNFNHKADRVKLDLRISAGKRWTKFLVGKEIGYIVVARYLPPSL